MEDDSILRDKFDNLPEEAEHIIHSKRESMVPKGMDEKRDQEPSPPHQQPIKYY